MPEWITYMTPVDLMARIRKDRAEFAALWAGLSNEQMIQRPGPQSDWSVKDLMAHIASWERHMLENVRLLLKGEAPHIADDEDTVNAGVFAENKDRALADVRAEFAGQMALLEERLSPLSEDQINDAQHFPQLNGKPLLYPIIGDTFGHYGVHRSDLERYVASLKNPAP